MPQKAKITVIGGGSPTWTNKLVKDMMLVPALSEASFTLLDLDREAAELNAAFLRKLGQSFKVGCEFEVSGQIESLEGSDYILITISTGGFDAMDFDISIPEKFGIFHTVGDTSGPGGWARAIRNYKPFVHIGETIRRLAPKAVVLNYTNPMCTLTDVLCRMLDNPVVGLCHGLFENIEFLKKRYGLEDETGISINYGGINHFFWCDQIRVNGHDVLDELRNSDKSLTELYQAAIPPKEENEGFREVATELFRLTGLIPYLGDRHTCEFFPWYITDRERMESYKIQRTSTAERRDKHAQFRRETEEMVKGEIPESYSQRSQETAADIIEAHYLGKTFIDVGNVPNRGQVSNLPLGSIVETAVRVSQDGFSPVHFGSLPDQVVPFVIPYSYVYKLTVDACFEQDRKKAIQALREDPVCAHLTTPGVISMAEQLLEAHSNWIDF